MDLLKSMKSLVMEDVEVPDEPKTTSTLIQPPKSFPSPSIQSVSIDTEKLDKTARDKIETSINEVNPTVYRELNDFLTTLAEDMPSEDSRYKTALKFLAKKNITPASIISDLDKCISAVETSGKKFSDYISNKMSEKIGGRKNLITAIEKSISEKTQQIQTLQLDITNLSSQKVQEESAINTETETINQTKTRFDFVYNQIHEQLINQKQKVINYTK